MRVFLTGASGFLGSYVAMGLLNRGHTIAVLLRDKGNAWRINSILDRLTIIQGCLGNIGAWEKDFTSFQPEAVIHTAWGGVNQQEYNSNAQLNNLLHIEELIACMKAVNCKNFIGAGSQAE